MSIKHILLFLLISCFNQSKAKHILTIDIKNCHKEISDTTLRFMKLYKLESSEDIDLGRFEPFGTAHFSIPDLKEGNYYLLFPNTHNKISRVNFEINYDIDTTQLTLCTNRYNNNEANHIPIISQLREGESYSIKIESIGCFHTWPDSIQIERINHKYYRTYRNNKKELTSKEYEHIQRFEMEFNLFDRRGGCTTTDTYTLTYNGQTLTYKDASCEWNGYNHLLEHLNLNSE